MITTTVSKTTFDLLQSKEYDPKAHVKMHTKAHVPLEKHGYIKSIIPRIGNDLIAVSSSFDKCFIKQFTQDKSPLSVLSVLLAKYVDVRGKFSLKKEEIKYTAHRQLPPEGIPIIRQEYFDDPLTSFRRFRSHMIQGDVYPDLLKLLVTPWATQQNLKLKYHSPTTLLINGKVHTVFLHAMIISRTTMRKKNEIYPGHPTDHCYFVSSRELSRFLGYIGDVAENYLTHQTDQVLEVKSRPIMKQFYKREFMANLAVFGSFAICFLIYLIYPRFGWWNVTLLLIGLGAGTVMGGLFGRLSYLSRQKKQEMVAEGFRELKTVSREKIREGMSCDLFQKTFCAEFPLIEDDLAQIPGIALDSETDLIEDSGEIELSPGEKPSILARLRTTIIPIVQSTQLSIKTLFIKIGGWARKISQKLVLDLKTIGSKIKTGYNKIIIFLKERKNILNAVKPEILEDAQPPIQTDLPTPKKKPKTKPILAPEIQPETPPSSFKTQKLQSFFSE
ncbi:MAG: hypothetical protein ACTSYI_11975 [Promethearchaeota archaeon]